MKKFECSGPEQMKPFSLSREVEARFLAVAREKDTPERQKEWATNLPRLKELDARLSSPERRFVAKQTTTLMEILRQGM